MVDRGIPPGADSSNGSPHFGIAWRSLGDLDIQMGGIGPLAYSVSIDGVKVGGTGVSHNPMAIMDSVLEEELGAGRGWLPFESYEDLGFDFWDLAPLQVFEFRRQIAYKFDDKYKASLAALKAELNVPDTTTASIPTINSALKRVQQKLAQWEDILAANIAKLMQLPAKDYLGRSINDIFTDLKKLADEYDAPAAIDQELKGFTEACETANSLMIRDTLMQQNEALVDNRSVLQAIAQAKLMAQLSAEEQSRALAQQPLFDRDYLSDKEGGVETKAYVPKKTGIPIGISGVTVGAGVDLGARTAASLLNDGVPESLVSILSEYTGLRGQQALAKLEAKPLVLSEVQARTLTDIYFDKLSADVERRYNSVVGADKFRSIPYGTRTAIIDLAFQHGTNLSASAPKSWQKIITGDWNGLVQELNNFGDEHKTRRKSEALLVQKDIELGLFR